MLTWSVVLATALGIQTAELSDFKHCANVVKFGKLALIGEKQLKQFPRDNYQTNSSETKILSRHYCFQLFCVRKKCKISEKEDRQKPT